MRSRAFFSVLCENHYLAALTHTQNAHSKTLRKISNEIYLGKLTNHKDITRGWGGGGGEATRPGTEKRRSHNLKCDPLGSGFKKGRENFPL